MTFSNENPPIAETPNFINRESLQDPEKAEEIISQVRSAALSKYDADLEIAKQNPEIHGISPEGVELGKLHLQTVVDKAREFSNFVGLSPEEAAIVEISAWLHDVQKFNPERQNTDERLLLHAHDSQAWAAQHLKEMGFADEIIEKVSNTILRHQPMPYVQNRLNEVVTTLVDGTSAKKGNDNVIAALREVDDAILARGFFEGPNDEASAVLYCADLLSMGEFHSGDPENPGVGAFDKIVLINLEFYCNDNLADSVESSHKSLVNNVAVLQGEVVANGIKREFIDSPNSHESESQDKADKLMSDIAKHYGVSRLNLSKNTLAKSRELQERGSFDSLTRAEKMAAYYKIAHEVEYSAESFPSTSEEVQHESVSS